MPATARPYVRVRKRLLNGPPVLLYQRPQRLSGHSLPTSHVRSQAPTAVQR
jgi:hypothetical protein